MMAKYLPTGVTDAIEVMKVENENVGEVCAWLIEHKVPFRCDGTWPLSLQIDANNCWVNFESKKTYLMLEEYNEQASAKVIDEEEDVAAFERKWALADA